jgi:dUTPase
MSVISVKDRVTEDAQRFQENVASHLSLLFLKGGAPTDSFSVELTVGNAWSERYGQGSNEMQKISDAGLKIARHGSIVIEVEEKIKVPFNMYGIIVPTGSLFLDRGILIAPAKVEPSFSGNLKLRLFNTTAFKHTIKKGDKLASIIFFSTETTKFQPEVSKKGILVDKPIPFFNKANSWTRSNINQIITWVIAITCSSVISTIIVKNSSPSSRQVTQSVNLNQQQPSTAKHP